MADRAGLVKVFFISILFRMVGFVVFAYTEEYCPNDEYVKASDAGRRYNEPIRHDYGDCALHEILLASVGGDTVCGLYGAS